MACWILYDYIDRRNINAFEQWTRSLETRYRAMLNRKLKALEEEVERGLIPGLIVGPLRGYPHIYKLKIGGRVKLRPLLCKGPIGADTELTFLMGSTEKDWEYDPADAPAIAEERRIEILHDSRRRCNHVKVL